MKKYIADGYLVHKGVLVKPGEELEMTVEQANRVKEKVTLVHVEPKDEEVTPVKEAPKKEEKPKKETTDKKESK